MADANVVKANETAHFRGVSGVSTFGFKDLFLIIVGYRIVRLEKMLKFSTKYVLRL